MKTERLFELDFVSEADYPEVIEAIFGDVPTDKLPLVLTANVDHLVTLRLPEHEELWNSLQKSYIILPDGMPIIWASRWLNKRLRQRLTGADLFPVLWHRLCQEQTPCFGVVSSELIGERLRQENGAFSYFVPPFFSLEDASAYDGVYAECLQRIDSVKPKVVLMGISMPKQQYLSVRLLQAQGTNQTVYLMLGASMEFYLGLKSRSPQWMQRAGLEWLYRLLQEPSRLFKRYVIDGVRFLPMVLREAKVQKGIR